MVFAQLKRSLNVAGAAGIMMLSAAPAPGLAQSSLPPSSAPNRVGNTNKKAFSTNILESDSLLSQTVDLQMEAPLKKILTEITRDKRVRLTESEFGGESSNWTVRVDFRNMTLRDAMDAIASSGQWRWERVRRGVYLLRERDNYLRDSLPQTDLKKERFRLGKQFLGDYGKLPPDVQKAMEEPDPNKERTFAEKMKPAGVPVSSLPPPMQEQIKAMALNLSEEYAGDGSAPMYSSDTDFGSHTVTLKTQSLAQFTVYSVQIGGGNRSTMWAFTDLPERLKARDEADTLLPLYNPLDHRLPQAELPRGLPADAKITLRLEKATIAQAADALSKRLAAAGGTGRFIVDAGIVDTSAAAKANNYQNPLDVEVVSKKVTDVPVGKVLEAMQALYPGSEWEMRRRGTLVVRSRVNGSVNRIK